MRKSILIVPAWYPNRFGPQSGIFNRVAARALAEWYDVSVVYIHLHDQTDAGPKMDWNREEHFCEAKIYLRRRGWLKPLLPQIYAHHFLKALDRVSREFRPPVLLYLRNLLPCGFGAAAARRRPGLEYVTRESFSGFAEQMRSGPKRRWARRILHNARGNSAVSQYQRDVMLGIFPDATVDVVNNIITDPGFEAFEPGPTEPMRIIYVGNIVPIKGWDLLLEGMKQYIERHDNNISLTVVGRGDVEALQHKIDELDLHRHVTYVGEKPREEIPRLIAEHHFLALPSRFDTCPNVVLEALAAGRPVLATRSGGAEDLVRPDNGILVEPHSPESLAEGIHAMKSALPRFDCRQIKADALRRHGPHTLRDYLERFL